MTLNLDTPKPEVLPRFHMLVDYWFTAKDEDAAYLIAGNILTDGTVAAQRWHPEADIRTEQEPLDTETPG